MHFVTSVQAEDHVSDLNVARFNTGVLGAGVHVLPVRGQFTATMVDSNTLRVLGGDAVVCGRHVAIDGDYEEISIENGTPGMKRIDLVVMHVELEASAICELRVLKGSETTGTPVTPTHIEGDLNDGDTVTEVPVCSVLIDGINPQEPVNLIQQHLLMPISDIRDSLSQCPYEVGDLYITTRQESPSAKWPRTSWERVSGRFLLAASEKYALGSTGGEEAHALTVAELAAHAHTVTGTAASGGAHTHPVVLKFGYNGSGSSHLSALATQASAQTVTDHQDVRASSAGAHVHTVSGTAASAGSGTAHNNMPPYLAVNVWQRTA